MEIVVHRPTPCVFLESGLFRDVILFPLYTPLGKRGVGNRARGVCEG